jgi:hypothetical protein
MTNRQKRKGWELTLAIELSDSGFPLENATSLADYLRSVRACLQRERRFYLTKSSRRPLDIPAKDMWIRWHWCVLRKMSYPYFSIHPYVKHRDYARRCRVIGNDFTPKLIPKSLNIKPHYRKPNYF